MKFSKAAMKTRHVKIAHLTAMGDGHLRAEPPSAPARRYSTEWYDPAPTNNGVAIPQQLRDEIEKSVKKTPAKTKQAPNPEPEDAMALKPTFGGWGLF